MEYEEIIRRLRELVVDREQKKCNPWIFTNLFKIGWEDRRHTLQKDMSLSISDDVLRRIWDELFELRDILHNPEDQYYQNFEVLDRLRSLVQMLPQNIKEEIIQSVRNFPSFSKEEEEKIRKDIESEIGSRQILTVGGIPFGEHEMWRKERAKQIMSIPQKKKIEEIIGNASSALYEALNKIPNS